MVLSLPQSYIVKPFATILKDLPQPCWHWLTGGTFDSATGGTFQSDTDGTFHSDIPGTFESDMGDTFKVLQSEDSDYAPICYHMDTNDVDIKIFEKRNKVFSFICIPAISSRPDYRGYDTLFIELNLLQ